MRDVEDVFNGRKSSDSHHINDAVWKIFRPVSPLWAAFIHLDNGGDDVPFPTVPANLPTFLAVAEGFRKLGEATRAPKRADTILKPGESLQFTDELRAALPQGSLSIPGL